MTSGYTNSTVLTNSRSVAKPSIFSSALAVQPFFSPQLSTHRQLEIIESVLDEQTEAERHFAAKKEQEKHDRAFALSLSMQDFEHDPPQTARDEKHDESGSSAGDWLHDGIKPRIATDCLVTDGSDFSERGKRRSLPSRLSESEPPRKLVKGKRRHDSGDVHVRRRIDRIVVCWSVDRSRWTLWRCSECVSGSIW